MDNSPEIPPDLEKPAEKLPSEIRLFLDLAPLTIFFISYKSLGIMAATIALIIVTTVCLAYIYYRERKLAPMPLVTGGMIAVLGTLTLILGDEQFIKMKPTIVNLLFATVLLGGLFLKKPMLKWALGYAIQLEERGWFLLSFRWGLFFLFLAGLNEVVWRNFSTDFWVNFKVFGMLSCTVVFTLLQLPLMKRYLIETEGDDLRKSD